MTTLEGKSVVKEGWLTMYKSRKPTFFSSRPVPDKLIDKAWAVLHQFSNKGPIISFYQVCLPLCLSLSVCVCVVCMSIYGSLYLNNGQ